MSTLTTNDAPDNVVAFEQILRLGKDIDLSDQHARFAVDLYYQIQEYRKSLKNQERAAKEDLEPSNLITWLGRNFRSMEADMKSYLDRYSDTTVVGRWSKSIVGLGPVIAAGLMAHIDIEKAPTAGHIWSFAGLNQHIEWIGAERAGKAVKEFFADRELNRDTIALFLDQFNRRYPLDLEFETKKDLKNWLSRRPHNAKLKVLTWKFGQCMKKFQNKEGSQYGPLLKDRKHEEWKKNMAGVFKDQAAAKLEKFKIGKTTMAFKWYSGQIDPKEYRKYMLKVASAPDKSKVKEFEPTSKGPGVPMLPPAHIQRRVERWISKIFLSHWQAVAYREFHGVVGPRPYVIEHLGHAHMIEPPNWPF